MDSALLAQLAADDCQRMAGLKALLLRKVGKANIEHMADLRTAVLAGLPHDFSPGRGIITLQNGSRIIAGHFQKDSDIDSYLGIEYDIVAVEEATGLSLQKYQQILTCCRSSKPYTPSPSGQLSPLNCQPGRDGSPNRPVHTLDASQLSTLNSQLPYGGHAPTRRQTPAASATPGSSSSSFSPGARIASRPPASSPPPSGTTPS